MPFHDTWIRHIEATLLVHYIKESPGGYKLSMEMIKILALAFGDCYLPTEPLELKWSFAHLQPLDKKPVRKKPKGQS